MTLSVSQTFDSFEEFNSFPHGWDADFRATTAHDYRAVIEHAAADGILLNSACFSQPTLQLGSCPPGTRTFAIPANFAGPMSWLNHDIDRLSLMVFPESRELLSVAQAEVHIRTVSLSEDLFERQLEQVAAPRLDLLKSGQVLALDAEQWQHLHSCLAAMARFCNQHQALERPSNLESYLTEELAYQLLAISFDPDMAGQRLPFASAARHVQRAMHYILAHVREPLMVAQVCAATGISRRTMEQSFRRYLAMSPKQLIKQLRLSSCREELLRNPQISVGALAERWGFWHMGQFSRDYRLLFGETPSATLKRLRQ